MGSSTNIHFGAFRHVDLTTRWRKNITDGEHARLTERHESHLETALKMPMYKTLPTGGFKYDWRRFRNHDGLFVFRAKGRHHSNHINNHVKNLSPEQMDTFCAEVFDKATQHLKDLSSTSAEDFWAEISQELGIKVKKETVAGPALWDWAMKLMAARIAFGQLEENSIELHHLMAFDTAGDVKMSEQPNNNAPDLKPLSLAAQAVDKFLALGISKYGDVPKKFSAISRHHKFTTSGKPGPDKPLRKDSSAGKNAPKKAQVYNLHAPVESTAATGNEISLRRSAFGSHVGAGAPAWWGSINQPKISRATPIPQWIPDEPQQHVMTARDSNVIADAIDDLVVGLHGTAIGGATKTPQVLTNLTVRTVNPLKRHYDDTEEAGDLYEDNRPPAKVSRVSKANSKTLGSPSQLGQP